MSKFVFILGAPNGNDGKLSTVSLRRIEAAVEQQRSNPGFVILATGGFGPHFNSTGTPHREFVYRHLEAAGAAIDRAESNDLLSSNTVEDIVLVVAFMKARGLDQYYVVTSKFHAARCRFIIDCLAEKHSVTVVAADDPEDLEDELREHEDRALRQLSEQGGVVVGSVLYAHPACSRR
jgi:DUF218 domain